MPDLRRMQERVGAEIPVQFADGASGLTRNVSASGLFFVTDSPMAVGQTLRFSLDFDHPGGGLMLDCLARIVRVEERDGRLGVGAVIVESRLERKEELKTA